MSNSKLRESSAQECKRGVIARQKLKKLKAAFMFADIDYDYLIIKLGRSKSYICDRVTGRAPWTIWEVYQLCDLLDIPYSDIPIYFPNPRDRQSQSGEERR